MRYRRENLNNIYSRAYTKAYIKASVDATEATADTTSNKNLLDTIKNKIVDTKILIDKLNNYVKQGFNKNKTKILLILVAITGILIFYVKFLKSINAKILTYEKSEEIPESIKNNLINKKMYDAIDGQLKLIKTSLYSILEELNQAQRRGEISGDTHEEIRRVWARGWETIKDAKGTLYRGYDIWAKMYPEKYNV